MDFYRNGERITTVRLADKFQVETPAQRRVVFEFPAGDDQIKLVLWPKDWVHVEGLADLVANKERKGV